ncbi:MAG: acetate/propionate family kinase [Bacteroidota bacterium]
MHILVINCGSSSLKTSVIEPLSGIRALTLDVDRLHEAQAQIIQNGQVIDGFPENVDSLQARIEYCLQLIKAHNENLEIKGVGHRVVHGGSHFKEAILIDQQVEQTIEDLEPLAPLHNPVNLLGIRAAKAVFDQIPHIAVFDTAFHQTLPRRASTYALPKSLSEKYAIKRYGFHGTSHYYVAQQAANHLQESVDRLRLITCHLGNGCSLAAIEYGRSIETSMGFTPLEGLVMGTRSGDLDPGILIHLMRHENLDVDQLDRLLNKESGLKGISALGNDMRDLLDAATNEHKDAQLSIQVFCHRVKKYIGAYAAVMGGVDAIIFTGGIGENSAVIRHRITQKLEFIGALANDDKNEAIQLSTENPVQDFSWNHSRVKLLAIKTDEALQIAKESAEIVEENYKVNQLPEIPIAISARHMHITQETLETLFGEGHQLTELRPLSQPGQFAAKETVTLVGPKNKLERVRILGPVRPKNQIEISRTDEFFLGVDAPVRESGKTENSPGIRVIGPNGTINLEEGLICAWRHIHMTPEDAAIFKVQDRDIVDVAVQSSSGRSLIFGDVLIRVSSKYALEMHIDTDEGNAAELSKNASGVLLTTDGSATLRKKRIAPYHR